MKNYFIANGEILNTNMSIKEMESQVQRTVYKEQTRIPHVAEHIYAGL